ncbi:MAG: phosphomannomutase/phosphoglucomutase [Candidatus Coproplasma sp.]
MEKKSYLHLKSGTDVRGVAIAVDGRDLDLTPDSLCDITNAFVKWLSEKTGKSQLKIAVGYDCRLSSEPIFNEVTSAMLSCGCEVVGCGLSSTPSMFMLLQKSDYGCDASVMITASHLPYYMNGLKFFTPCGGLDGKDVENILLLAERGEKLESQNSGRLTTTSFMDEYSNILVETVREATGNRAPLFGHIIIADASNGVGGFFVKKVLQPLGAITTGSINLYPDGRFPAHAPNPEAPEAMKALQNAVLYSKAELGVIFDTDVDRAGVVDGDGTPINRDSLIALVSADLLKERPCTIVTDSVTSDGLTEFIENHGGKHIRFKRGYKNVINEAKRRNEEGEYCPLAIETSGHASYMDNYFLDDGAYLICKVLIAFSRQIQAKSKLSDIIKDLKLPEEECEIRIKFNDRSKNFKLEGERVINEVLHFAKIENVATPSPVNYEGLRLNFGQGVGDGWTLVRMSVHDPVMPVNFASNVKGGVKLMAKYLYAMVAKYPFLDLSALKKFIEE